MQVVNHAARQVVEASGFEVFDPFAVGLHAPASWYNDRGHSNHADALSDAITQQLLNQLCADDRNDSRSGLHSEEPAARPGAWQDAKQGTSK